MNAASSILPTTMAPSSILPACLLRPALESRWLDHILRRRAADILRLSALSDWLPNRGLLLDLGAGSGHVAEAVQRAAPGRHCVMIDPVHAPARHLARRLARRGRAGLTGLLGDGTRLPFPPALFEGAWASFVLHHVPPPEQERMLDEIARVLRPGAPFVLLEDTPASAREAAVTLRADRRLNAERQAAPHHYRAPEAWPALLARHGLVVREQIGFSGIFPRASLRAVRHTAYLAHRTV